MVDEPAMDHEFMSEMDWDFKTARPNRKKLEELGLNDIAGDLWGK